MRCPLIARSGPRTWIGVSRMPDPMIGSYEDRPRAERVEVITSVQRRRRWSTEEKVRIVEETYLPGNSVSLVARRHGIAGNQLFTWRRLMAQGALTAAGAGEEVVPASELRAAHHQIRELQRLLGKKTLENEILREAVERVTAPKKLPLRVTSWPPSCHRLHPLGTRIRPSPGLAHDGSCAVHDLPTHIVVSSPTDPAEPRFATGRILARHQADPGSQV